MFAQTAEEFLRKEVIPREDEIYAKNWETHRELMRKAGELGLLSIDIPEKYGGLGLNKVSSAIVGEQFALQASFAGTQSSHVNIGTLPIVFFGTEEQKKKYLPRLATGEMIGAYALTEPQSGSDALAAKTKAVLSEDGTHYVFKRPEDVDNQRQLRRLVHGLRQSGWREVHSFPRRARAGPGERARREKARH